jgi:alkylated DNA repair dioxygenase AlkB
MMIGIEPAKMSSIDLLPVRVYPPRGSAPVGAVRANVTSKATASQPSADDEFDPSDGIVRPFAGLSPFNAGPVTVYPGRTGIKSILMENGYQYMKLYSDRTDDAGYPTLDHARWMLEGIRATEPRRFPMGRGAKPICSVWRNRLIGYVESRLYIYIPLYVEAICRNADARAAFLALRDMHRRTSEAGVTLAIYDYDGYDHVKLGRSLVQVAADPYKKMGHAFVLAAMLEDKLLATVREAAAFASLPIPGVADLPPDIASPRSSELMAGLIGGAKVYYRAEFLNCMAQRYFESFRPGGPSNIPWNRGKLMMYGRECNEGHQTAYFGDKGTSYFYSGFSHEPAPWSTDPTGALAELLAIVRMVTGESYNFCLMNLYEPSDSIGAHSDDERDLVRDSSIFSVSLGCARVFELIPKGGGGASHSKRLAHGSAIIMAGLTQVAYKHRVEAEKRLSQTDGEHLRVNLTFRCVKFSNK